MIAGASIAEVAPIVLLSLFFSGRSGGVGGKLVLLAAFVAFVAAVAATIVGLERSRASSDALLRLQDTSAQIRVRGAFLLLALFVVFASEFGLEAILGAFFAGATLRLVDRDEMMTHTFLRAKLEAVGFGVFVPFFFVSTGMKLDVRRPVRRLLDARACADLPRRAAGRPRRSGAASTGRSRTVAASSSAPGCCRRPR